MRHINPNRLEHYNPDTKLFQIGSAEPIYGEHQLMLGVFDDINTVISSPIPVSAVFLHGATGTGKELVARALHEGYREKEERNGPFVAVNCRGLQESVFASEVFGHKKGSFTDAKYDTPGLFGYANGGTLFLDEIADLPESQQAKLLRVVEYHTYQRVGDPRDIESDARLIFAASQNLRNLVCVDDFRKDFYFRIEAMTIGIPSLSERRDDILGLANYCLQIMSNIEASKYTITPEAEEAMLNHSWQGNVRELYAHMKRAVIYCRDKTITPHDLNLQELVSQETATSSVHQKRQKIEPADLTRALEETKGNIKEVAVHLGVHRTTVHRLINEYGLDPKKFRK
jgi:DNA-binding NtrC family response regulator